MKRILLLGIVTVLLCGCSSILERYNRSQGRLYPGVRLDYIVLAGDMGHYDGWELYPLRFVWGVVDLPFSLAFDTALLPWDLLIGWLEERAAAEAQERDPPRNGNGDPR